MLVCGGNTTAVEFKSVGRTPCSPLLTWIPGSLKTDRDFARAGINLKDNINFKGGGQECPPHTGYCTTSTKAFVCGDRLPLVAVTVTV